MDPETAVLLDPVMALVGFLVVIVLLLVLIAKFKWHVFLALLLPILFFGIIPGVQINNFIDAFESGFGGTLGGIGVIIVLGSIIAEALKHTGAIEVITRSLVNALGSKRMPLVLTLSGFILGIAVFSDVAYVILNPLVHSSAAVMGTSMGVMATGLVGSLQLTHAIVPPTPGPLAAAALLGADVGTIIILGGICCLVGSLAGWVWGQFIVGPRIDSPPSDEFIGKSFLDGATEEDKDYDTPGTLSSYAPILVPIILIGLQSVFKLTLAEGHIIRDIFAYVGWPVIALTIGVWLAFRNITNPEDKKDSTNKWVEDALKVSAMILVVTGLGGSLSHILRGTPAVDFVADFVAGTGLAPLFLPFLLGVIGNMITGSTTVGVITAGALVAPMLDTLGLSPEAAMLSAASGAVIIKYVNSSYFWVCTSLSRMDVKNALICYGGATFFGGLFSFITTYILWMLGIV